jgi:hypothetical protein
VLTAATWYAPDCTTCDGTDVTDPELWPIAPTPGEALLLAVEVGWKISPAMVCPDCVRETVYRPEPPHAPREQTPGWFLWGVTCDRCGGPDEIDSVADSLYGDPMDLLIDLRLDGWQVTGYVPGLPLRILCAVCADAEIGRRRYGHTRVPFVEGTATGVGEPR